MNNICPRCGRGISTQDDYCRTCGAHPETGLTVPEAENIWLNIAAKLQNQNNDETTLIKAVRKVEPLQKKRTQRIRSRRQNRR